MFDVDDKGLFIISDSGTCPGIGPSLSICKEINSKPLILSISGNYSHFKALSRKFALNPFYLEVDIAWKSEEFPVTETPPITWLDPSDKAELSMLPDKLQNYSSKTNCILIDNIADIYHYSDKRFVLLLINTVRSLFPAVIVRIPDTLIHEFALLEESCDFFLELRPLESGFSTEYTGKLRLCKRIHGVRQEVQHSWYIIKQNQFSIVN